MTILIYLFLIAVFFPYIKFFNIGTNTDTQFYSIILGLIIIIIYLINRKFIINKNHEYKRGVKAGYAKFETFPIWNIPLKHPVNLAYEAATADLN